MRLRNTGIKHRKTYFVVYKETPETIGCMCRGLYAQPSHAELQEIQAVCKKYRARAEFFDTKNGVSGICDIDGNWVLNPREES